MSNFIPFNRTRGYESINDGTASQRKPGLPRFADATNTQKQTFRGSTVAFGVSNADLCALNEVQDAKMYFAIEVL